MFRHVKHLGRMQISLDRQMRQVLEKFSLNFFLRELFITHEEVKSNKKFLCDFYRHFSPKVDRMRFQSAVLCFLGAMVLGVVLPF